MENTYVSLIIEKGVGYIEFFHPKNNALPTGILKKLEKTIVKAGSDTSINVIVIKSGGDRTFCAGASFNEIISIENKEMGVQFFSGFANVINAMRNCPKLIIGRVQGKAIGGGVGIIAATDYCLATKYASIKLSELSIGIGPFVIEPAVSRKIGKTAFGQMAINAEAFFSPMYAKDKGLYAEVFDTTKELDDAVILLADKLSSYNPKALLEIKKVFWENTGHWETLLHQRAKISGQLVLSEFTKNAINKFIVD